MPMVGWLKNASEQMIGKFQPFWDVCDDIDVHLWVLEPNITGGGTYFHNTHNILYVSLILSY